MWLFCLLLGVILIAGWISGKTSVLRSSPAATLLIDLRVHSEAIIDFTG